MKTRYILLTIIGIALLSFGNLTKAYTAEVEKRPIKIGLTYELTGVNAGFGKFMFNGATQLFEEKGLQVAGRKIELITGDDGGTADAGLARVKKFVEFDKVDVISGIMLTPIGYAIRDYIHQNQVPTVLTVAGAGHTRKLFSPYFFRVGPSAYQYSYQPAKWFARHGYKKLIWMGMDFAPAHEGFEGWKRGFEEEGGKIVQEIWTPWVCTDYGPYLSQVKADEADALLICIWAESTVRVVNQYAEYGLKKRIPIIGFTTAIDESVTLPAMGANAEGAKSWYIDCAMSTDIPSNKAFVQEFKRRYGQIPDHHAYLAYVMAQAIYEGLTAVNGNVEDKEKFLDALRGVNFTTPMGGRAFFDKRQGMQHDFYALEVRKTGNGEYHNFLTDHIGSLGDPYDVFP